MTSLRLIGPGRAGQSLALALSRAGWEVLPALGRGDELAEAAAGVDALVISAPDAAVSSVAAAVEPVPATAVLHLAGSLGVDVLEPHAQRGALHPLVSTPTPELGAIRLQGAWFGVAADGSRARDVVDRMVADLGGRAVAVDDASRVLYHAAAAIASNHLVALLGQVERVAAGAGVPLEAYLDLARGSLENAATLGPGAALTGPVARGDWTTVARHRSALAADELPIYDALVTGAARLAGREVPPGP